MAAVLNENEIRTFNKDLQQKIKSLTESGKTNNSTIARAIKMSPATLSLYLNSSYNGNVEELENNLKNYINFFERKENTEIKSLHFVETSIANKIFNAANMCQMRGKMGVCYGTPGIGKTTAVLEYQKTTTGVIVVDPFEQTSVKAVLIQIADQLKLNYHHNMSLDEFTSSVIKKLEKNKYLLIIDEAENLKVDIFKIIRKIHDKTKNNCGVLFVGTQALKELLLIVRNGFPYITNRIGYVAKLDELKISDIKQLILQYYPNITDSLVKSIADNCKYNARFIQNLLDLCFEITSKDNKTLTLDLIETAKETLLI